MQNLRSPFWAVILVALFGTSICAASAQCFWADGSLMSDIPCNSSAPVSNCCGNEWACLSGGVCYGPIFDGSKPGYVAGSCTDRTWASDACQRFCYKLDRNTRGPWALYPCSVSTDGDPSFCCHLNDPAPACSCNTGENALIFSSNLTTITVITVPHAPSTSSYSVSTDTSIASSTTATPATTTASPTTSTASPTTNTASWVFTSPTTPSAVTAPTNSQIAPTTATTAPAPTASADHSLAIGAGIGGPVGLALIGVLLFLLWQNRRLHKALSIDKTQEKAAPDMAPRHRISVVEAGAGTAPPELLGDQPPCLEVDGREIG